MLVSHFVSLGGSAEKPAWGRSQDGGGSESWVRVLRSEMVEGLVYSAGRSKAVES